jgi:hypothetical protein
LLCRLIKTVPQSVVHQPITGQLFTSVLKQK